MATVLSIFPGTERGKALGLHMTVVGLGVIVGPALGGALVGEFGWRSVFFVNGPVSLIGIAAAAVILNPARLANQDMDGPRQRFDWLGAVLSAGMLLVFLLVVTNGYRAGGGPPGPSWPASSESWHSWRPSSGGSYGTRRRCWTSGSSNGGW